MRDDLIGNPFCEGLDLIPAELRLQRHDHMQPLAAGGLGEALQADRRQGFADAECGLGYPRPRQTLVRVEIEGDPVGGLQSRGCRAPGVDFEHVHLHQPDEPGQILNNRESLGHPLLGELDVTDRGRRAFAEMLLIEARFALAAGAAHQG